MVAGATLAETDKHQFLLSSPADRIELTAWFSPQAIEAEADDVAAVQSASRDHWKKYWTSGGAIDLVGQRRSTGRGVGTANRAFGVSDGSARRRFAAAAGNRVGGEFVVRQVSHGNVLVACRPLGAVGPAGDFGKESEPSDADDAAGPGDGQARRLRGREMVEDDRSQRHGKPVGHWAGARLAAAASDLSWRSWCGGRTKIAQRWNAIKDIVFETANYMATFRRLRSASANSTCLAPALLRPRKSTPITNTI